MESEGTLSLSLSVCVCVCVRLKHVDAVLADAARELSERIIIPDRMVAWSNCTVTRV